jgi:hypothetical protein
MSNEILSTQLQEEIFHFIDRLECILDSNNIDSSDLTYVKIYLKTFKNNDLMNHVVKKMLPWKPQIEKRKDDFFYKNKEIFGKLPEDKVDYFSDLWKNDGLGEEDKDEIWDFFDAFIAFAEEYKKNL